MLHHDFQKQNLVTTPKGDLYKCSECKAQGYRAGLSPFIILSESEFKKSLKCEPEKTELPKEVSVKDMPYVGIVAGTHKVVKCPEGYTDKYADDVWVFSESRGEAVRLLPHEYKPIN